MTMPDPITPERLASIEARAEAATPGPWTAHHRCVLVSDDDFATDDDCGLAWEIEGPPEAWNRGQFERGHDAAFISSARDDIPSLCAALRQAWTERDAARARAAELEDDKLY
jgi:hypothetical protein